jgi:hypothetical protein
MFNQIPFKTNFSDLSQDTGSLNTEHPILKWLLSEPFAIPGSEYVPPSPLFLAYFI